MSSYVTYPITPIGYSIPKGRAGQLTVIGLLMIFLSVMVFSMLSDTLTTTTINMSDNLTAAGFVEEGLLTRLIPMFIIVTLLASIAMYGSPQT